MIALHGLEGFVAGQVIAVPEHGMRIGRRRDNDLVLEDPTTSSQHAAIEMEGEDVLLVDLQSTNGTYINGIQISRAPLTQGDEVRIGDCVMRYRDRPEAILLADEHAAIAPAEPETTHVVRPPESRATVIERQTIEVLQQVEGVSADRAMQVLGHLAQQSANTERVDAILDLVLELVFEVVAADRGAILLIDGQTGQPTHTSVRYRDGGPPRSAQDMPISSTLARRVISEGLALLIPDATVDPTLAGQASIVQHGIRCAAYVPLVSEERVIGLVCLDAAGPGALTDRHLEVLTAFANQATLSVERVRLKEELTQEIKMRMGLQRYVSPQVAEAMLRSEGRMPPSDDAEVTVLFADLTGFTAMSEQMPPAEICALLNAVFELLTEVVFRYGGTVDKYIGDCIMAVWGAPFPDPLHPARAVVAAVAMMQELERQKQTWAGKYADITLGIAVNSGPVTVGNIGSDLMQQWTAIGDVVNVAARIEDLAGPNQIMLSAEAARHCESYLELQSIGQHTLKGKQETIEVFLVVGVKDPLCFDQLSLAEGAVLIG